MSVTVGLTLKDLAFLSAANPVSSTFPVTSGLLLRSDSTDFDAIAHNTNITTWLDTSGNARHWVNWQSVVGGRVDQTVKAGGHATVNIAFDGVFLPSFRQTPFFAASGFTGLEVMAVAKRFSDPPNSGEEGAIFEFNHPLSNFGSNQPFTDSNFYEGFGRTDRPSLGNPTTSFASAFRVYNVAVSSTNDAYDAWLDTENFFHATSGYTFQTQGFEVTNSDFYYLGFTKGFGGGNSTTRSWFAALYVWNRRLTTTERASMRTYINSTYGTSA